MKYNVRVLNEDYVVVNNVRKRTTKEFTKSKGLRRKVFLKDVVIKLDDSDDYYQSSKELILWKRFDNCDRIFFGKIVAGRRSNRKTNRIGWIAQEKIKFKPGRIPSWAYLIVERLAEKYGLSDISVWPNRNWAMNNETGLPVIFDFGITYNPK